jgi:hypothetical protein
MSDRDQFERDATGDIFTRPVVGWLIAPVAGMSAIVAIQYVETPLELERGDKRQIQFVLTPQQCLELAEALTKQARDLLNQPKTGKPPN